jgi:MFS family permease
MKSERWLRIIPVALIMYTISYVDRTNVNMALTPSISSLMKDLFMDDRMKGEAAGIFFFGYVLMQMPGGYFSTKWSPRKVISLALVCWGICAVACGLAKSFRQFEAARFLLGVSESGVYPSMVVLLANWFPSAERARANAFWNLCQPIAVVATSLSTGWLLGLWGWQRTLVLEGMLPFLWLPIWWFGIRDHPREAKWISSGEREFIETTLASERAVLEPAQRASLRQTLLHPTILLMVAIYFLHNCQAYGCMAFFTDSLKGRGYNSVEYGIFFAIPFAFTAVVMMLVSWHSDKKRERPKHLAAVYLFCGTSLVISMLLKHNFWASYIFLCLSIPGPSAALAPLWAIPTETLPRSMAGPVVGFVNALGNVGGFVGPYFTGWLTKKFDGSIVVPFSVLGVGMVVGGLLCLLLPKTVQRQKTAGAI